MFLLAWSTTSINLNCDSNFKTKRGKGYSEKVSNSTQPSYVYLHPLTLLFFLNRLTFPLFCNPLTNLLMLHEYRKKFSLFPSTHHVKAKCLCDWHSEESSWISEVFRYEYLMAGFKCRLNNNENWNLNPNYLSRTANEFGKYSHIGTNFESYNVMKSSQINTFANWFCRKAFGFVGNCFRMWF